MEVPQKGRNGAVYELLDLAPVSTATKIRRRVGEESGNAHT